MTLTTAQLEELTTRVYAMLKEFDMPDALLPSKGVIRIAHTVITEWQAEQLTPADLDELAGDWPSLTDVPDGDDVFPHLPVSGLPDPDAGRDKLAHALANGHAQLTHLALPERRRSGMVQPTLDDLCTELRRQSMGGVMPSTAQFNLARPATWGTAQAQRLRLGMSWTELAEAAGLKPNRVGNAKDE